jgi:sporulation protein YlmC with PRC-barrel domain
MADRTRVKPKIFWALAVVSVMSLGMAPAWAQQNQQSKSQNKAAAADGLIAASALEGTRVVDKRNREIGSISNIFIDPQTGKMARAGIEFNKETFGGQKYSVTWEQMSVKRQDGKIVVALDESVLDRVQSAAQRDKKGAGEMSAQQQQRQSQNQHRGDRQSGGSISGSETQSQPQQLSASQLSSSQIRKIQQELNKEGFHAGQVNGQWSSETQTAIKNFQETKGLPATGDLDQRTIEALGLNADDFRQKSQTGSDSGKIIEPSVGATGASESNSGIR